MLVDIFYYAIIMDKPAIVNFLLEQHYIQENEALAKLLSEANRIIARQNQEIENLQDAVVMLQTEINTVENQHHVLVDRNGRRAVFRRNQHQIFEEVEEEPIENVRRRLDFDDVLEVDERELMDRLMFGTP
jgi:hypothetical protein